MKRFHTLKGTLKILCAAPKTQHSRINKLLMTASIDGAMNSNCQRLLAVGSLQNQSAVSNNVKYTVPLDNLQSHS